MPQARKRLLWEINRHLWDKQTKIEAPYNHICDFSHYRLNVRLNARIQPLLRGHRYGYRGLLFSDFGWLQNDYLSSRGLCFGRELKSIYLWRDLGEYWEVAAGCGVGFRQFRLTYFFVCKINLKNISYISYWNNMKYDVI